MKSLKFRSVVAVLLAVSLLISAISLHGSSKAQDAHVEIRILWYSDGNEGDVLRSILDRYEAENNVKVVLDTIPYADLHNTLQAQIEGGEGPDIARINDVNRFKGYYLDLTPYVAEPSYWATNFPQPVLDSLRSNAEDTGIYGFPLQFSVTGAFINRTLFEQAGVPVPSDSSDTVSWQEWEVAAEQVADATETPYAIAIDRSGHRFWALSLPLGATYVNEDVTITVDSEGFREAAQLLIDWHQREVTPRDVWLGAGGDTYASARDYFVNGQLVLYIAGSWQVGGFVNDIGDLFDWQVIPTPVGPGGNSGIPGGSLLAGLKDTEHPEQVAKLIEFLAQPEQVREFSEKSLFLPGQLAVAAEPLNYESGDEALQVFASEVLQISEQGYALQYHPLTFVLNTNIRDRLSQVIAGEITLDEAIARIQQAVDEAAAQQAAQ